MSSQNYEKSHSEALEAINAAEALAANSDSNDQELSLLRAYLESAIALLPKEAIPDLARSMAKDAIDEVSCDPYELQTEHLTTLLKFSV